jgi:hypothetical protein
LTSSLFRAKIDSGDIPTIPSIEGAVIMRQLTSGEWRLFLLSDCIKYYKDIAEYTVALRKEGKNAVLQMNGEDTRHLDNFIDETDAKAIRGMLRKEWRFTGKVVDNGRGIKTTCEYCQKQQIRYKYLCRNDKTNVWLELGSVCVGYVIHGEDKMKDKDFSDKFVADLDKLKGSATSEEQAKQGIESVRAEQEPKIRLYTSYLRKYSIHTGNSDFLKSLSERWANGKTLTDNQMEALKDMCKKCKYGKIEKTPTELKFKNLDAEIQYQKVLRKLEEKPDSQFYQACKLRIEREGELTPNMARALMGGK